MLSFKDIFLRLLATLLDFGELKKSNYYGDDFATIELEKDGKQYCFSMRCEEKTNKENENE